MAAMVRRFTSFRLTILLTACLPSISLTAAEPVGCRPQACNLSVAFSPDSQTLVVLHPDGNVRLWEVAFGKQQKKIALAFGQDEAPEHIRYSPDGAPKFTSDGKQITFFERHSLHVWDVFAAKSIQTIALKEDAYDAVLGFSRDGRTLVSCDQGGHKARFWEKATGKERQSAEVKGGKDADLLVSPDGKMIAVTKKDTVLFQDIRD